VQMFQADSVVVIPARWASSRFPGKMLALFRGVPIVVRVARQAALAVGTERVVVVTDHPRIADAVDSHGFKVECENVECSSGTARVAWMTKHRNIVDTNVKYIVNVQGDEPMIDPEHIQRVLNRLRTESQSKHENLEKCQIATLATPIRSISDLFDENCVKVVRDRNNRAMYFSRSPIPHIFGSFESAEVFERLITEQAVSNEGMFLRHIGIYGFTKEFISSIADDADNQNSEKKCANLANCESLEQLEWLQNAHPIRLDVVQNAFPGIDTPEDIDRLDKLVIKSKPD